MFDRDDEIGCHPFGGVDEKHRTIARLIFYPKREDLVVSMEDLAGTDPAIGDLKRHELGRGPSKENHGKGGEDHDDGEECVV